MKVCFAGDLFLGGDLLDKSAKDIIHSDAFNNADMRILNLEQPISDNDFVSDKCTLYTNLSSAKKLKDLDVSAVNLANNHIQDKGLSAVHETVTHLKSLGIESFGAGLSISDAKKPFFINEEIAVFGYCEYGKPYLNQIAVADAKTPGINPLRYENIMNDLSYLSENQKAILYFHWGREHVFLPPVADIKLAQKLLEDDRILVIIGMHAHRPQGVIKHNGKKAYMCLGNFLFPNFFIKPPVQIYYPDKKPSIYDITRQYHYVYKVTYKKWRWINRFSLLLVFDTEKITISHKILKQDDNTPTVKELSKIRGSAILIFIRLLSAIYLLPKFLYSFIEKVNSFFFYKVWHLQILFFLSKQLGFIESSTKVKNKIKNKIKR